MIYSRALILIILLTFFGCGTLDLNDVKNIPNILQPTFNTDELLKEAKYSFIIVELGNDREITMVLSSINNNIYKWISSELDVIYTINGKIIKIDGFNFNFRSTEIIANNKSDICPSKYSVDLRNPDLYSLIISCSRSPSKNKNYFWNKDEQGTRILEKINAPDIFWNRVNEYIFAENSMPKYTNQEISPIHPRFKINFYYKY
jgi:hypothetical protein